jgi:hypothetical protein
LLVDPDNPVALAHALVRLLIDAASARAMGDAGAKALASWDTVACRLRQGLP